MLNQFKCFSRPYSISCLDDDRDFLELLAMAVPSTWDAHYFSKTTNFIDYILHNTLLSKRDFSSLGKVFQSELSADNSLVSMLSYWRHNPQRWSVCEVGLIDFSMPKMSGLDVLRELPHWQGLRILLSGVADEKVAVEAFNDTLINQYIPKQSDNILDRLKDAVRVLSAAIHVRQQLLVQSHLSDDQLEMLRDKSACVDLISFAQKQWIEYVVLSNPFGILGLSENGQLSWLQLQGPVDVVDLKNMTNREGWDAKTFKDIQAGNVLPNRLLRHALNDRIPLSTSPIMSFGRENLFGAFFEFEAPIELRASISHKEWFSGHRSSLIRD
jgi:CheY-like chemotaxis protein